MARAPHLAEACITCSDEAVPMTVLEVDRASALAVCLDARRSSGERVERGERVSVEVALLEPVAVGELLLVHAGTAIARASIAPHASPVAHAREERA